ncbi:hypothetical protein AB6A40_007072, partial [Gnathostoma spinigerum]
ITYPKDMVALANTREDKTSESGGWKTTEFDRTPNMSSYALAFAIGKLGKNERTVGETKVRIWAWGGLEAYTDYALDVVSNTLQYMEKTFNKKYPPLMKKLDVVALPQYTNGSRALENWGLICAIHTAVLINPTYSRGVDKGQVARILSHEVVHQWFGNLVTMSWWSHIFLNEAFANFWSSHALSDMFPQEKEFARYLLYYWSQDALTKDAILADTKPIISTELPIFNFEPYEKGASILDMLDQKIGHNVFIEGLRAYVAKYAEKVVTDVELWDCITTAAKNHSLKDWNGEDLNVTTFMNPWMYQASYPVIKVITDNAKLRYEQEPMIDEAKLPKSTYSYKWPIAVKSRKLGQGNNVSIEYFNGKDGTSNYWKRSKDDVSIDNVDGMPFYRVWYDSPSWAKIEETMKKKEELQKFNEYTLATFITDAYALAERKSLPWERLLSIIDVVRKYTKNPTALRPAQTILQKLAQRLKKHANFVDFKNFQFATVESYMNDWVMTEPKTKTIMAEMNSADLSVLACATDDSSGNLCRQRAENFYKENFLTPCEQKEADLSTCNKIPLQFRRIALCYGVMKNTETLPLIRKMYDHMVKTAPYFESESDNYLFAMSCVPGEFPKLTEEAVSGNLPPKTLFYIKENDPSNEALWKYFVRNVDKVRFGVPSFQYFIEIAVGDWSTKQQKQKVSEFIAKDDGINIDKWQKGILEDAINRIDKNIEWMSKEGKEIMQWITRWKKSLNRTV